MCFQDPRTGQNYPTVSHLQALRHPLHKALDSLERLRLGIDRWFRNFQRYQIQRFDYFGSSQLKA